MLNEAFTRYNLDAVPTWSPSYGSHISSGAGPLTAEAARRTLEWGSIIGDCWRIPHDNRIQLCFADESAFARVRECLEKWHPPSKIIQAPGGECFNVLDWFDSGDSVYWYPGKKAPNLLVNPWSWDGEQVMQGLDHQLSTMVAPWRRMMYDYHFLCISSFLQSTSLIP